MPKNDALVHKDKGRGSYPFRVGTVTSVSCMQLLRSINSPTEDSALAIESVLLDCTRSFFTASPGKTKENNFITNISCVPIELSSASVIIWTDNIIMKKGKLEKKNQKNRLHKIKSFNGN